MDYEAFTFGYPEPRYMTVFVAVVAVVAVIVEDLLPFIKPEEGPLFDKLLSEETPTSARDRGFAYRKLRTRFGCEDVLACHACTSRTAFPAKLDAGAIAITWPGMSAGRKLSRAPWPANARRSTWCFVVRAWALRRDAGTLMAASGEAFLSKKIIGVAEVRRQMVGIEPFHKRLGSPRAALKE